MKGILFLSLVAIAFPVHAQDGWISLFNGKDLTGWKMGGDPSTFTVKDGAIVAKGQPCHLFYEGPVGNHNFKNFELKVEVMTAPNSNGGVYFHTDWQKEGWPEKGFEVQVNNTHPDPIKTGSLYHVKDLDAGTMGKIARDNEWFTEHITVQGNTVVVRVNDKEVVRWTQPPGWKGTSDFAQRRIGSGTIALQGHDPGSTVKYRNIQIKMLP